MKSLSTLMGYIGETQMILGLSVFVLGIIVLILWLWYYRLYRATGLIFMSNIFSEPEKVIIPTAEEKLTLGMHIGISSGLFFERDILEVLPPIREAGFDQVEIWAGPQRWGEYTHFNWHKDYRVHALSICLKVLGLKVNSLHAPFSDALDLSDPNELRRRFAVNEVLKTMEVLKYLNGNYLVIHPASNEESLKNRDVHFKQSRKSIEEIYLCMQGMGVKLAVENQLPHILGGSAESLLQLIEGLPGDVGLCLDTSHANLYGQKVENTFQKLAGKVVTIHASDNGGRNDDHLLVGDGNINWPALVSAMKASDYRGVFMMEVVADSRQSDKMAVLRTAYQRARDLLVSTGIEYKVS